LAEAFALLIAVYRQPGQERGADWVIGQTLGNTLWALLLVDGAGGQGVVAGGKIPGRRGEVLAWSACWFIQAYFRDQVLSLALPQSNRVRSRSRPASLFFEFGLGSPTHDRRLAACGSVNKRRSRGLPSARGRGPS